jgi:histone H3/H4
MSKKSKKSVKRDNGQEKTKRQFKESLHGQVQINKTAVHKLTQETVKDEINISQKYLKSVVDLMSNYALRLAREVVQFAKLDGRVTLLPRDVVAAFKTTKCVKHKSHSPEMCLKIYDQKNNEIDIHEITEKLLQKLDKTKQSEKKNSDDSKWHCGLSAISRKKSLREGAWNGMKVSAKTFCVFNEMLRCFAVHITETPDQLRVKQNRKTLLDKDIKMQESIAKNILVQKDVDNDKFEPPNAKPKKSKSKKLKKSTLKRRSKKSPRSSKKVRSILKNSSKKQKRMLTPEIVPDDADVDDSNDIHQQYKTGNYIWS